MVMRVSRCSIVVFVEATGQESRWWKWETRWAKIARLEMSSRDGPASAPELRIKLVDYSNSRKRDTLYNLFIGCEYNDCNNSATHTWTHLMELCGFQCGLPCDGWENKSTTTTRTTFGRGSLLKLRVACPTCSCIRSSQCSTALFSLMIRSRRPPVCKPWTWRHKCNIWYPSRGLAHRH